MKKRMVLRKFIAFITLLLILSSGLVFEPIYAAKKQTSSGSIFPAVREATGRKVFIFDSQRLSWAVYDASGHLLRTGHAVGGKAYCKDIKRGCRTPVGTFAIYQKVGPHFRSSKYPLPNGGALMPWGMFFHGGYAIHGSNDVPNRHASHGCIRVVPANAKWLSQTLPIGSTVIVRPY